MGVIASKHATGGVLFKRWVVLGGAALAACFAVAAGSTAEAQAVSGAGLCKVGQKVEYAKSGRRFPGKVEGDNGKTCIVYARAYMGAIDVAYADLRPDSGAPEEGKPDIPAAAASPAATAGAVATTTKDVYDAFRRDPAGAKARYVGKRLRFTGLADNLRPDAIWFKQNLYETVAVCMVEPSDREALRQLKEGAQVTVEGFGSDRGNESIFIQQCRVVRQGPAPVAQAAMPRPPQGRYICMNAGRGIGNLTLGASTYTVDGVTGNYRFDPASKRLTFTGGSYPKWGWTGEWRTDPAGPGGPPEPRIVLTDGKSLHISCFPPK